MGFLLPATPGFNGAALPVVATLAALALAGSVGYEAFLGRPGGRAATAVRQVPETTLALGIDPIGARWRPLTLAGAATALAGALYVHLVGSVETTVVFSPTFSVLPLVLGMLGGALHPLGGILGTLALYPLDALILRPAFPDAHTLAYGLALIGLLLVRPEGLLKARVRRMPTSTSFRCSPHEPFTLAVSGLTVRRNATVVLNDVSSWSSRGRFSGSSALTVPARPRFSSRLRAGFRWQGQEEPFSSMAPRLLAARRRGPAAAWPGRSRLPGPFPTGRSERMSRSRRSAQAPSTRWTGSWRSSS